MKTKVVLDINAPQEKVAALFADPANNTKWMHDLERYEPLSGEQGMPGSTYRLIPKQGSMVFTATVVSRNLPDDLRLRLAASNVTVDVHATLSTLPDGRTRLVSEEEFTFKGFWSRLFGLFARRLIRKAHRKHIEAFKRFAEL
jgi:polyketide cyclase/dehydrase/lipid transport protein